MSMKKKFLALALAGAVAMPVVANATGVQYGSVTDVNTQTINSNLQISGNVTNNQGTAPSGKLLVELPTAMSFTVDQNGNFNSAKTFTITNKGTDAIDVEVAQFTQSKPNEGITIKTRTDISGNQSSLDRSNVSIVLRGTKNVDLGEAITTPKMLVENLAGNNNSMSITVDGLAGTGAGSNNVDASTTTATLDKAGTSEEFTLRFLVSKHS